MNQLEQKPEEPRSRSLEDYRASTPERLCINPNSFEFENKQRQDFVIQRLHKESRRWKRMYRIVRTGYFCSGIILVQNIMFSHWLSHTYPFFTGALEIVNFALIAFTLWASYYWHKATKEMAASADIRDIGALIESMEDLHTVTNPTLLRLLPKLCTSDQAILQEHHRESLRRFVGSRVGTSSSTSLVIAILKAYEQIGDEDDIPVVEKIAAGGGYGKYKNVRQAAEECLPALRIVAPQHRQQVTLLRASSPNSSNPADLVRAIESNSDGEPQEMLRVATVESGQA